MITSEKQYNAVCARIDELFRVVSNNTPADSKDFIELDLLSDWVAGYEEATSPVKAPKLVEVIKLRMCEMGINQTKLSEMLGISPSRVSEYLTEKCEPTLPIARTICQKLNISASIALGV
jgi:HTH-type transcriptional regulator/antitoxin HigA